ncbi:MAG TPA: hypothetical protein VNV86_07175 [Candidatus Acidoferrum sp.]|nr:hypothetical protein [Candidatus Acidoferrum sp.]
MDEETYRKSAPIDPGYRRFLALSGLIFLLLVLRRPDAITNPQFWAEDGPVFFFGQITHTGLSALFVPYAGYLLVVPRLVAAFAALFPASSVPLIFNLFAFAIAAFCCSLFSLNWYRYLLQSDWLRAMVCVVIATAVQADELVGTITCIHCFLFLSALLILLQPAEVYEGRFPWPGYLSVILGVLSALSEPLVVLLLPLSIWFTVRRKGRASLAPAAIMAAAVVQIAVFLLVPFAGNSRPSTSLGELIASCVNGISYHVVLSPLVGIRLSRSIFKRALNGGGFAILVLLGSWLTYLWWRGNTTRRWIVAVISYLTLASVALAIAGRSLAKYFSGAGGIMTWRGERYFFPGACLFVYLIALSIEKLVPARRKWGQAIVLVAVFAFGMFWNFRVIPFTDYHWDLYAPMIDRWLAAKRSGIPVPSLSIPINPLLWMVDLKGSRDVDPPPSEGQLIRKPGAPPEEPKVYLVEGGRKRWIVDGLWIQTHGYQWPEDVHTIPSEQFSAIPMGPPIQ